MEAAEAKLDNLITQGQFLEQPAHLYPLDQSETTVEIEIVDGDESIQLWHRLKRPTLDALIERDQRLPHETEVLGGGESRLRTGDFVTANARLWDQFAVAVKGYEYASADADEWMEVTPALALEIPYEHKSEAITGFYGWMFEIERPKSKGFVLGATIYRIRQTLGPYTIWHTFGKPTEGDRRELARKATETRYRTGAQKVKSKVFTHLKVYVEIYDRLFRGLEGVSGGDPNISQRKDLIDPLWKRGAIDCLMGGFEASRRDLSTN
jgi:hypothetical protein